MQLKKNLYKFIFISIFCLSTLLLLRLTYFNFITVHFALTDSPESTVNTYYSTVDENNYKIFKDKLVIGKNYILFLPYKTNDFFLNPIVLSPEFKLSKIRINGNVLPTYSFETKGEGHGFQLSSQECSKIIMKVKKDQKIQWFSVLFIYFVLIFIIVFYQTIFDNIKEGIKKINFYSSKIPIFLIVFIAVFWVFWPFYNVTFGLDGSWMYAVNKIFASGEYLWGKDIMFTYGPLGFLAMPLNIGNNLSLAVSFYLLLHMTYVAILVYLFKSISRERYTKLNIFLLLSILSFCLFRFELAFLILNIVLLSVFLHREAYKNGRKIISWLLLIIPSFVSGISLFIKFNLALTCLGILVLYLIGFCVENRKILFKQIALSSFCYLIPVFSMIALYFKSSTLFLIWLKYSFFVASGFSEAMTTRGPYFYLVIAVIGVFMYLYMLYKSIKNKSSDMLVYLVFAPFIFFQFKHGFVRQDGHMLSYFWAMMIFSAMTILFAKELHKKLLISILIFSCLYTPYFYINLRQNIFGFIQTYAEHIKSSTTEAECDYSESWVSAIGDNKIQLLPWDFGCVGKHNLNQQFNPILQLYSVYTKELDSLSAKSYVGAGSPRFVIMSYESINGRNMFFDTPSTFETIKENYHVRSFDNEKIMLEKNTEPIKQNYKTFDSGEYGFNKYIEVPQGAQKALITIELNPLGKITNLFYHITPLRVDMIGQYDETYSVRIIRDTLENGLFLNNIPTMVEELNNWFIDRPNTLSAKKIKFNSVLNVFYKNKVKIQWQK